jgi:hypothetical protein
MDDKVSLNKEILPWHLLTASYNHYDAFGELYNYTISYSQKTGTYYVRRYDKQGRQIGSEEALETLIDASNFVNDDNERSKHCIKQE